MIRRLADWLQAQSRSMRKTWLAHFAWTFCVGLLGWPFGHAVLFAGLQTYGFLYKEVGDAAHRWLADKPIWVRDGIGDSIGPVLAFALWVVLT